MLMLPFIIPSKFRSNLANTSISLLMQIHLNMIWIFSFGWQSVKETMKISTEKWGWYKNGFVKLRVCDCMIKTKWKHHWLLRVSCSVTLKLYVPLITSPNDEEHNCHAQVLLCLIALYATSSVTPHPYPHTHLWYSHTAMHLAFS